MENTEKTNRNSLKRLRITIQVTAIILAIVCYLVLLYFSNREDFFNVIKNNFFWLSTIVGALAVLAIGLSSIYDSNNKEVANYYNATKNAINNDSIDIMELMILNMKEIKDYYVLSRTMANASFVLSIVMSISGFIIIFASVIMVMITDISMTRVLMPVISGTVIELLAGTTLVVYKNSLEQLNLYYKALHKNERFLSLVRLVDKISKEKKNEVYIKIINRQLESLKEFQ